ncbi:MAG: hypothetical protein BGP16_12920 [Sphingobium sp. 66-54]|nr:MAG: hypothetical protein BGP16_12920 [Sphingobium sp. 66-54]
MMTGERELGAKLDRALGRLDAIIATQTEQSEKFDHLSERVAKVEQGVCDTRDVVAAWTAAKTSMRFIKWVVGLAGAVVGLFFALKGGLGR